VSTAGLTAASAAGMSSRVPRAVRAASSGASRAAGGPGTQLWASRYNEPGNGVDDAATGAQQWAKRYTGSGPGGGAATWASVSPTTGRCT